MKPLQPLTEQYNPTQFVFDFYWDHTVRRKANGQRPYGLTFEFWA